MSGSEEKPRCRFIERCPMFPIFQSRSVLRIYQIHYCEGRFEDCARYQKASTGTMPPPELLPDGERLNPAD